MPGGLLAASSFPLHDLVALMVPAVTGIVGALGLVLKESRRARDRRNIREQALAEARAEVAFCSEWWQAHQLLGTEATTSSTAKALELLAEAESKVTSTQHLSIEPKMPITFRRLLMLRPTKTHKRGARILRVLFWISLAWLVLGAIILAQDATSTSRIEHAELGSDFGAIVFFALTTLLLRAWASRADQPEHAAASPVSREPAASGPVLTAGSPGAGS
jgi:hypothetical protein